MAPTTSVSLAGFRPTLHSSYTVSDFSCACRAYTKSLHHLELLGCAPSRALTGSPWRHVAAGEARIDVTPRMRLPHTRACATVAIPHQTIVPSNDPLVWTLIKSTMRSTMKLPVAPAN